jgi:hypothetical protein
MTHLPRYDFKPLQELLWSVLTAVAVVLLMELVALNPDGIASWRSWAIALGTAMLRAGAGAALDWLRRRMADLAAPEPAPAPAPTVRDDIGALVVVLHATCGKFGLAATRPPAHDGEMLNVEDVRMADGSPFRSDQIIRCSACYAEIDLVAARRGSWIATSGQSPEDLARQSGRLLGGGA